MGRKGSLFQNEQSVETGDVSEKRRCEQAGHDRESRFWLLFQETLEKA